MVIVFAVLVVGFIGALIWMIREREFCAPFGLLVCAVLLSGLIGLVSSIWSEQLPIDKCEVETQRYPIVAVQDNMGANGSFVLGCGSNAQNMYYYYMRETPAGFRMENIKADKVYIVETDDIEPCIETLTSTGFKNWYDYILNVPWCKIKTTLYVPTNTVFRDWSIDLK